jgi:Raf kinase inhibitor-like YbhB/YbcL family protein
MRKGYALLGATFVIVLGSGYFLAHLAATNHHASMLTLSSLAFQEDGVIPSNFTCDGENVNPALSISGVPEGTQSLVLIMDDPDIPQSVKERMGISVFDHWVLFNIPPETRELNEAVVGVGIEGSNGQGVSGYTGPCPPDGEHRYVFKLFALDTMLNLHAEATREEVERAMEGHSIDSTELTGRYNRTQSAAQ